MVKKFKWRFKWYWRGRSGWEKSIIWRPKTLRRHYDLLEVQSAQVSDPFCNGKRFSGRSSFERFIRASIGWVKWCSERMEFEALIPPVKTLKCVTAKFINRFLLMSLSQTTHTFLLLWIFPKRSKWANVLLKLHIKKWIYLTQAAASPAGWRLKVPHWTPASQSQLQSRFGLPL